MSPTVFISQLAAMLQKAGLQLQTTEEGALDLGALLEALRGRLAAETAHDAQAVATVFNQIRGEYEAALYHELVNGAGYSEKRVRRAFLAARQMVEKLDAESIPQVVEAIFEEEQ